MAPQGTQRRENSVKRGQSIAAATSRTYSVHLSGEELHDFELLCELKALGPSKLLRSLIDDAVSSMGDLVERALKDVDLEAQRKKMRLEAL